ncbi:hypothetical protein ACFVZH_24995 [Streptomyces sp. NPDC059534]|uniref:hypothetical protein n=1 Tax=Streptomyces sp. NPDC059534 TaxID=3346859 RepID=UPI0036891007
MTGLVVAALCLGGALTACGDGDGDGDGEGYAAVGAGPSPKGAVAPSGAVTLVPLDGPTTPGLTSSTSSPSPAPPDASTASGTGTSPGAGDDTGTGTAPAATQAPGTPSGPTPGPDAPPAPGGPSTGGGTAPVPGGQDPTRTPTSPAPTTTTTRPPTTPGTTPPPEPGPAVLTVSAPGLADGDRRWCERVTVTFRNTGGSAATSGTVTFATHVIGALGVDWATVTSTQSLPAPIAAGTARTRTYTVCVDSWRVPLGMRIDTRGVTAVWR